MTVNIRNDCASCIYGDLSSNNRKGKTLFNCNAVPYAYWTAIFSLQYLCHIFHINNWFTVREIEVYSRFIIAGNMIRCVMQYSYIYYYISSTLKKKKQQTNSKSINKLYNRSTASIQLKSIEFNWQNEMSPMNVAVILNKTKCTIKYDDFNGDFKMQHCNLR